MRRQHSEEYLLKNRRLIVWSVIGSLLSVAAIIFSLYLLLSPPSEKSSQSDSDTIQLTADQGNTETQPTAKKVENYFYESPMGPCSYTGEVDNEGKPHGKGVAEWKSGDAKKYDGQWNHGKMEGEAVYTLSNDDMFVGTFKNNEFEKGKYTIKTTGEYFEGSFLSKQPHTGTWHDKGGATIQSLP